MKERSLRDLFHVVGRVLPDRQELVHVSPGTSVAEALETLKRGGFNQLPVVQGSEVLGVFSYRSLSQGLTKLPDRLREGKARDVLALPVDNFMQQHRFATINDELAALLDEFDLKDVVLVGDAQHLIGIVTTSDTLKYFYFVASPYVLLREIELAIRELIRTSVDDAALRECCAATLKARYQQANDGELPERLEDLTFSDYVTLLTYRGTWQRFSEAFGKNQDMAVAKLAPLSTLRNDVFHFRRELTVEEYDTLRDSRDWLLNRIRTVEAKKREAAGG